MSFDIKDLVGLGKFGEKLLEVVREGVGGAFKPRLTRANTRSLAHRIDQLADKVAEAKQSGIRVEYKSDDLTIAPMQDDKDEITLLLERAEFRHLYQEVRRQINLESITAYAAGEFSSGEGVSTAPVDSDWITRFFDYAPDVSSESLQQIWGKILAGEVKQPSSFSLRTLELVRNLSTEEANLFGKAAPYVVRFLDTRFAVLTNSTLHDSRGFSASLTHDEIVLLVETGFISSLEMAWGIEDGRIFTIGSQTFSVDRGSSHIFEGRKLSRAGSELLSLMKPISSPIYNYLILDRYQRSGAKIIELYDEKEIAPREITADEINTVLIPKGEGTSD